MAGPAVRGQDLPADRRRRQRLLRELSAQRFSPRVLAALAAIPRHCFLPDIYRSEAYRNQPLAIGCGQTISQPEVVARMLDMLSVGSGQRVLDVGSGSGYVTALLAHLVGPEGRVDAVERHAPLVAASRGPLGQFTGGVDQAVVALHQATATVGWPDAAPYDRIHVGCAAHHEVPAALIAQLASPGRMLIPVAGSDGDQYLVLVNKAADGSTVEEVLDPVLFVPLR